MTSEKTPPKLDPRLGSVLQHAGFIYRPWNHVPNAGVITRSQGRHLRIRPLPLTETVELKFVTAAWVVENTSAYTVGRDNIPSIALRLGDTDDDTFEQIEDLLRGRQDERHVISSSHLLCLINGSERAVKERKGTTLKEFEAAYTAVDKAPSDYWVHRDNRAQWFICKDGLKVAIEYLAGTPVESSPMAVRRLTGEDGSPVSFILDTDLIKDKNRIPPMVRKLGELPSQEFKTFVDKYLDANGGEVVCSDDWLSNRLAELTGQENQKVKVDKSYQEQVADLTKELANVRRLYEHEQEARTQAEVDCLNLEELLKLREAVLRESGEKLYQVRGQKDFLRCCLSAESAQNERLEEQLKRMQGAQESLEAELTWYESQNKALHSTIHNLELALQDTEETVDDLRAQKRQQPAPPLIARWFRRNKPGYENLPISDLPV